MSTRKELARLIIQRGALSCSEALTRHTAMISLMQRSIAGGGGLRRLFSFSQLYMDSAGFSFFCRLFMALQTARCDADGLRRLFSFLLQLYIALYSFTDKEKNRKNTPRLRLQT